MTNQDRPIWENARALRETKLSDAETLSLVEEASSGARAWVLRGARGSLPRSLHHPAILPMTGSFLDERGPAMVFPSLEAATLRQTLDALREASRPAHGDGAPLGERLLSALRTQLHEPAIGADQRTWSQGGGRLTADLCLQIVRIAAHLEANGHGPVSADRLLLTPFGRVVFWEAPMAQAERPPALCGAGSVVSELIGLEARDASDPLSVIGYAAHPEYPQDRYASLGDLAADLERYLAGAPVHASRPGKLVLGARHLLDRPRRAAAAFAFLAAVAAATIWGFSQVCESPAEQPAVQTVAPPAPQEPKPAPKAETTRAHAPESSGIPAARNARGPNPSAWDRVPGASFPSPR